MGYILPITQYEYSNYQKRDIKNEHDFHDVEKPFKIKLDLQQQFNYDQNFTSERTPESKQIPARETRLTNLRQEQLIANITGKGALFNEVI